MRFILVLGAVVALSAAPAFAEVMNGDTGQVIQPGQQTPVASGAGNAGSAGTLSGDSGQESSTAQTNAGGQAGLRTGGAAPLVNKQ
jgi:hypothetical protein